MPALIHNASTATQTIKPLVPSINLAGLDSASMEIDFHGSVETLLTTFAANGSITAPGHPLMYCCGVGDISSARFGWIQCTIRYRGFWYGEAPLLESFEAGTSEQLYPYAAGDVLYFYSKPPGTSTDLNPATSRYWRVKDINDTAFITRRGVSIGAPGTATASPPPKPSAARPSWMDTGTPRVIADPLISSRSGWVRRKYSVTGEETLGSGTTAKVFRTWEDTHEWIDQKSL